MIIGKPGTKIPYDKALDYVAGYCMGIDMTVRGKEDRSFRKSIDGYSPVGPWIVTADEIPDPDKLDLELKVNGVTKQSSNVDKLIWNIREIIADLSTYYHLQPGDLIYTGTPEGVGAVVTGDKITGRVEGMAELSLTIGAAA